MEVVRVADLRAWIRTNGADPARVLQGLGMAPRNAARKAARGWKVTVFDVRSEWMCRPLEGTPAGEDHAGVVSCSEKAAKPMSSHRRGLWLRLHRHRLYAASTSTGVVGSRVCADFCVMPLSAS